MAISIISGFDVTSAQPADLKSILASSSSLTSISSSWRYNGMTVYTQAEAQLWQLIGGVSDSNWVLLSRSGSVSTASYSLTASYALNGGNGGSNVSASWASSSLSASYSISASYAQSCLSASWSPSPHVEKGLISGSSFSGAPQCFTVNYNQSFLNTVYITNITGEDARLWTCNSRTTTSFVINSNSNQAILGMVSYQVEQI